MVYLHIPNQIFNLVNDLCQSSLDVTINWYHVKKSSFRAPLSICGFQSSEMAAKMEVSDINFVNFFIVVYEHRILSVDQFELRNDQTESYILFKVRANKKFYGKVHFYLQFYSIVLLLC